MPTSSALYEGTVTHARLEIAERRRELGLRVTRVAAAEALVDTQPVALSDAVDVGAASSSSHASHTASRKASSRPPSPIRNGLPSAVVRYTRTSLKA